MFRLRQEAANLWRYATGLPALPSLPPPPAPWRPPAAIALDLHEDLLQSRFRLFGSPITLGPGFQWRRDPLNGRETPAVYFRRVPYLDFAQAGDHKNVWEPNRHQHWVQLAEAFAHTGDRRCLDEIARQWTGWFAQNPWLGGINWTSALEVAFRAISWTAVDAFAGAGLGADFRAAFLRALHAHGVYLENNLSVYFSPNTHLLGEAVALHLLGALYPSWPRAARWRSLGAAIVDRHLAEKVRADGSYFELSSYYQGYALDFFALHYHLRGEALPDLVVRMAQFLAAIEGAPPVPPRLGDDDGGALYPALPRPRAAAPSVSRLLDPSGLVLMVDGHTRLLVDAGPFAEGSAGHSHSDCLSLLLSHEGEELLVDAGTFTYVGDLRWREAFRGSAFHNTVRIAGRDQAESAGPFRWRNKADVAVTQWLPGAAEDRLTAECRYGGFVHRRTVVFEKPASIVVSDEIEGPPGEHLLELFWHCGLTTTARSESVFETGGRLRIETSVAAELQEGGEFGWRSTGFGTKRPAPVIVAAGRFQLPYRLITRMSLLGMREAPGAPAIIGESR